MIGSIGDRAAAKPLGLQAAAAIGLDAQGRLADPMLRAQIAEFEVDEAAFRLPDGAFRRPGPRQAGAPGPAVDAEVLRRGTQQAPLGADDGRVRAATRWNGRATAPSHGDRARTWLRTKANSIEGGTSEVQLNIVAKRILELPGA
jgi:acyl-CoA dehydrogenase